VSSFAWPAASNVIGLACALVTFVAWLTLPVIQRGLRLAPADLRFFVATKRLVFAGFLSPVVFPALSYLLGAGELRTKYVMMHSVVALFSLLLAAKLYGDSFFSSLERSSRNGEGE
jgi:hypothetical protein